MLSDQMMFCMKLMKKRGLFLIVLLPLVLSGCGKFEDIVIGDIQSAKFVGFVNNSIAFNVDIPVTNPTHLTFKIKEVNLKTTVDGSYLGKILSDEVVTIPAKSDKVQHFLVKVHLANIFGGAAAFNKFSKNQPLTVEIEGYVKVHSLLLSRRIKIHETQEINGM